MQNGNKYKINPQKANTSDNYTYQAEGKLEMKTTQILQFFQKEKLLKKISK